MNNKPESKLNLSSLVQDQRDPEKLVRKYVTERCQFWPIKVPANWTKQRDITTYNEYYGETDDYRRDTYARLESAMTRLSMILDKGIKYYWKKRFAGRPNISSVLGFREKVVSLIELFPEPTDEEYTLRIMSDLAYVLWLDNERERIMKPRPPHWLYPLYVLCDSVMETALKLEESFWCENKDFNLVLEPSRKPRQEVSQRELLRRLQKLEQEAPQN